MVYTRRGEEGFFYLDINVLRVGKRKTKTFRDSRNSTSRGFSIGKVH